MSLILLKVWVSMIQSRVIKIKVIQFHRFHMFIERHLKERPQFLCIKKYPQNLVKNLSMNKRVNFGIKKKYCPSIKDRNLSKKRSFERVGIYDFLSAFGNQESYI
jgi:hypothetical protein